MRAMGQEMAVDVHKPRLAVIVVVRIMITIIAIIIIIFMLAFLGRTPARPPTPSQGAIATSPAQLQKRKDDEALGDRDETRRDETRQDERRFAECASIASGSLRSP